MDRGSWPSRSRRCERPTEELEIVVTRAVAWFFTLAFVNSFYVHQ